MIHTYLKEICGAPATKPDSSEHLHLKEVYRLQHKFNPSVVYKLTPHDVLMIKKAKSKCVFGKRAPKWNKFGLPVVSLK